jgi:dihydroflavonol-4-reductase
MPQDLVLVTGGSGFIGIHCIVALLNAGYPVRTTVRSLDRQGEVLAMLQRAGINPEGRITFAATDLMSDEGWPQAVTGCRYVLHVASPFHIRQVKHEDELVVPAREGTLRVLRASRDAGVERVVLTSSFAAIGYGHPGLQTAPYTEGDWTDINGDDVSAYIKSKALAERDAWDFLEREGGTLQLVAVNPTAVFGPALGPKLSGSVEVMQKMLNGESPAAPRLSFGVVDVRDVADLHLLAMTNPAANGQRFLAVAGPSVPFVELSQILRKHLGQRGRRLPTREVPDWIIRIIVLVRPDLRAMVPLLGKRHDATAEKAKTLLGWQHRTIEEALTSTADSLFALGLIKS